MARILPLPNKRLEFIFNLEAEAIASTIIKTNAIHPTFNTGKALPIFAALAEYADDQSGFRLFRDRISILMENGTLEREIHDECRSSLGLPPV